MSDHDKVLRLIARLPADGQRRTHTIAQILRDLIEASGKEAELAFTLIMAELASDEFTERIKGEKS